MSASIRSFSLKSTRLFLNEYAPVTPESEFWENIGTDPLFPSVKSIDFHFGFPYNNGTAVDCETAHLVAYDKPFMAEFKSGQLTLVTKIDDEKVLLIDAKFKPREITINSFEAIWSGRAFILEHYKKNSDGFFQAPCDIARASVEAREKIEHYGFDGVFVLVLSLIGYICLLGGRGLYFSAFSSVAITTLLFDSSTLLRKGRLFVNRICGTGNDQSCAKAFEYRMRIPLFNKEVKITDLGLYYYLFVGMLMLGSFLFFDELDGLLFIALVLPLGFIPIALYLQEFMIKKWCKVCLLISSFIVISSVDLIFHYNYGDLSVFNGDVKSAGVKIVGILLSSAIIIVLSAERVRLKESLGLWKGYNNFLWCFPEIPQEIIKHFQSPDELPEMYVLISDNKKENAGVLHILLKPGCKHCATILEYFRTKSSSYLRLVNLNFIIAGFAEEEKCMLTANFQKLPSLEEKFRFLHLKMNEATTINEEKDQGVISKRTGYPSVEINGLTVPPFLVGKEAMLDFVQRLEYNKR